MSSHYFDANPEKESRERLVKSTLRGKTMTFTSDQGVFSKNEVDFGSRLLVNSFEWPDITGDILDMGCGYGSIGITLARETERTIWMADVNNRALSLSSKNAEKYELDHVKVVESDLFSAFTTERFAAVLSNPPIRAGKQTVHHLFEEAYSYLLPGGALWIVIQKKQGAPSAEQKLKTIFGEVKMIAKKKGYYIFCATKD